MVIFLHGKDSYRLQERVAILRNGFEKKYDATGTNSTTLAGSIAKPEHIRSAILNVGLFASKRFTVIKDVFGLSESSQDILREAITDLDEDSIVVCTAEKLPPKKDKKAAELRKALEAADLVEEYAELNDTQLVQWVTTKASRYNLALQRPVISYLQDALGNDLWQWGHVLTQLAHCGKEPSLEVVRDFVESPVDDNIFHLTDALSDKQTKQVLTLLDGQFAAGANTFYIVSMLARQIGILIEMKETNGEGSSLHPYVIKKSLRYAQKFDLAQLYQYHADLLALDYALKSSAVEPRVQLDTLLVKWTES